MSGRLDVMLLCLCCKESYKLRKATEGIEIRQNNTKQPEFPEILFIQHQCCEND